MLQVLQLMQSCGSSTASLASIYPSSAIQQVCTATGLAINPCGVCYCQGFSGAPVGGRRVAWGRRGLGTPPALNFSCPGCCNALHGAMFLLG